MASPTTDYLINKTLMHKHKASDIASGVLPIANGGTNASSFTSFRILGFDGTSVSSIAAAQYATSGPLVTFTAQAATDKPLVIKGAPSQSASIQEWQDSSGNIQVAVGAASNSYFSNIFTVSSPGVGNILTMTGDGRTYVGAKTGQNVVFEINQDTYTPASYPLLVRDNTGNGVFFRSDQFFSTNANFVFGANSNGSAINMVAPINYALNILDNRVVFNYPFDPGGYQLYAQITNSARIGFAIRGAASQSGNLTEWQDNATSILSAIKKDGSWQPPSIADGSASNNSLYYSTTASKLVYKDSGGTVNALY